MMVIRVQTEFDALQLLESYIEHARGVDVLVCAPAYYTAKMVAKNLFWKYPDSERRLDIDRVTLKMDGNRFQFMGAGDGSKVRGQRVPIVVMVMEGMPTETFEIVARGAAATNGWEERIKNQTEVS